jgi:hypothetical protein
MNGSTSIINKTLRNMDTKVDPCGMPDFIIHEEWVPKIETEACLLVKWLRNQLTEPNNVELYQKYNKQQQQ